jgi:hypothetical protein
MRTVRLVGVVVAAVLTVLVVTACDGGSDASWHDSHWGITVGHVPEGFSYSETTFHETWAGHLFTNEDGSEQFIVSWSEGSGSDPGYGECREVTRSGQSYLLCREWQRTAIGWTEAGDRFGVSSRRVDSGPKVDVTTLWLIAESVTYEPLGDG